MTAEGVRASRTGDRYHYFWAARQALRLLDFHGDLTLITIEGAREGEAPSGEEVIDVGEYYGGKTREEARLMRWIQLKHSTVRVDQPITSSELQNTLAKFADLYRGAAADGSHSKLKFTLVTNRRLNAKVRQALDGLAGSSAGRPCSKEANLLRRYMGFGSNDSAAERDFCYRLTVEDRAPDINDVEHMLKEELHQYIPGGGLGTETSQLMDEVARLATSQSAIHSLDRAGVLVALRVNGEDLFPAPSKIEVLEHPIRTGDVDSVIARLRSESIGKFLITAVGGVGKSIFTTLLRDDLDAVPGSVTIVYDCFAGGDYRRASSKRHLHRVALTQIANEIATRGLCGPLIPSAVADDRSYVSSFMRRLNEAADQLRAKNAEALLSVIVDAADNAIVAAGEFGERPFVADLFREDLPANVRLVALSRPERAGSIELPSSVESLSLTGFRPQESLAHVRLRFGEATEQQAMHLHQLSGQNPRVQAMAMGAAESADEAIAALEVANARPGGPLDALLAAQVDAMVDQGQLLKDEVRRLCQALAALHPAIPLVDLSAVADMPVDAVRSFAVALGRGVLLDADTLQFRDEPTETWFKTTYRLNTQERRLFAEAATELAGSSPYMAKELPQVYFEAEMLEELMRLALSESSLPGDVSDLQRKEINLSRVRYALAAALRSGRNADAALLAVRAGEMSAGHARRMQLYRKNTDLTAAFLAPAVVESLCSGRELATNWPGSNLHVEAALLSYLPAMREVAFTRFHSSFNNMRAVLQIQRQDQAGFSADIDADDVTDLAIAALNLEGPAAAAAFVERWRPPWFAREVAEQLFARMGDAGRDEDVSLAIAAARKKYVRLAAADIAYDYGIQISSQASSALAQMLLARQKPFKARRGASDSGTDLRGVVWALLQGLKHGHIDNNDALRILEVHLPRHLPDHVGERWHGVPVTSSLVGYALRSRLTRSPLSVESIVSEDLAQALAQSHISDSGFAQGFQSNIPGLLPWAKLLVDLILDGCTAESSVRLRELTDAAFTRVPNHQTPFVLINGVAELATRALAITPDAVLIDRLTQWIRACADVMHNSRLVVIRNAGRSQALKSLAVAAAAVGYEQVQADRTDSANRVDELIGLARAVLVTSKEESRAFFNAADEETELVGDDLYARWSALTRVAASLAGGHHPERAYRLFQIGETIDRHTEWGVHDLVGPLYRLHPNSYYSAVSRARDRRTLDTGVLLKPIFTSATERRGVSRLSTVAMGPRVDWREVVRDLPEVHRATANAILTAFSIADSRTDVPDEFAGSPRWQSHEGPDLGLDPKGVFVGADFTIEETWNLALGSVRMYSAGRADFVRFACEQQSAQLADVLLALIQAVQACEADFVAAARFAASSTPTPGVRQALADLARAYAVRFARHICARGYESDELNEIANAAQWRVNELLALASTELGRMAHELNHEECFNLASKLAALLPKEGKDKVFDALAALFDELAPPSTTSDGSFSSLASAPPDQDTGLAGLLWTALGDISIRVRWQAAHAVLLLVQFGDTAVLPQLAKFADGTLLADAYSDLRFPAYELHSRMWLLLAIERAASEPTARSLEPFTPWLESIAHGPPHAINQLLAINSLRTLSANGAIDLSASGKAALTMQLGPTTVELDWAERRGRPDPLSGSGHANDADKAYPFFFDFQRYWCSELADLFGSTGESVAKKCASIAGCLTGYEEDQDDPRRKANVYRQDSTYSSHRSWPEEEDHDFYSAIHALLTLGAELAKTEPAYRTWDIDADPYTEWTRQFLTKRRDGRWLSDRRDPAPSPAPEKRLAEQDANEFWPWSICSEDFDDLVGAGEAWITVHAAGYTGFGQLAEGMQIDSALVAHGTGRALVAALQTSPCGSNIGPDAHGEGRHGAAEDDADSGPYTLTSWLDESAHHDAIDADDERGRNLPYPPARPKASIVEHFALSPDQDMRLWVPEGSKSAVFRSLVWDNTERRRNENEAGTRGQVLRVHKGFLGRVLKELDKSLVVQVRLRRQVHRPYYQRKKSDEFDFLEWSCKTYLVDPNGRWIQY